MAGYQLTPAAERDLQKIWRYSSERWGMDQADRYLERLDQCCEHIAKDEALCRSFAEIDARLKSLHCEHHYVFFLSGDDQPVVIALLHERMDLLARLKDRLV